jgi:RNA polymerase sigma factor (sigma-70 family)
MMRLQSERPSGREILMSEDMELLKAWEQGDLAAGSLLVRRYERALHRYFARKTKHGVDDLVQETLLACVLSVSKFRNECSFSTYLFRIARYQLYGRYRRHLRMLEASFDEFESAASTPSDEPVDERTLLAALERLPQSLRRVLELSYFCELTQKQISESLGLPSGTVASRLRRGREMLRRLLDEDESLDAASTSDRAQLSAGAAAGSIRRSSN